MSSSTNNSNNAAKLDIDAKEADIVIKKLKKEIDEVSKSLENLAKTMNLSFDSKKIIEFGKQAIGLAADLGQVDKAVDAAFGNMSQRVDSFASTALERFGLTEAETKSISTSFMNMGKSLDIGGVKASDMALSAAQRVGDLISYYGITKEQAIAIMNSAWTGEEDGLNAIGIAMDEATLDAFAMKEGFGKTTKEMTAQEAVMLRYQYVMTQTGAAAGDFERNSENWANQTTILTGSWKEFLALMGTGLIEILTPAKDFINSVISTIKDLVFNLTGIDLSSAQSMKDALQKISDWMSENKGLIEGVAFTVAGFFAAWKTVTLMSTIQQLGGLSTVFKKLTSAIKMATIAKIKDKLETMALHLLYAKDFVVSMASSTAALIRQGAQWVVVTAAKALDTATTWASQAATMAATAATWLLNTALTVLTSPITLVIIAIGALIAIVVLLIKNWDWVKETAASCWEWIKSIWGLASAWLNEFVIIPIQNFFIGLWEGIKGAFSAAWEWIKSIWNLAVTWINEFVIISIQNFFIGLWEGIKGAFSAAWEWIKSIWNFAVTWINGYVIIPIQNFFTGLWEGIKGSFSAAWEWIKSVWSFAVTWINGYVIIPIKNFFTGLWDGIKNSFTSAFDFIKSAFKNFVNGSITMLENFINFFIKGINSLIGMLNKISFKAPDWLGGKTFGINIKTIPNVSIPRLATGAVIPPNSEFLAVLGDQRKGRNLEAPESLIRQIVKEEGSGDVTVIVQMPGGEEKEIFSTKNINRRNRISGKVIVPVGV